MTKIERIGAWFLQFMLLVGLIFLLVTGCAPKTEEPPVIEQVEVTTDNYTYDVPLAPELQLYINNLCEDYSIDPALILAIIKVESNFKADAIGDNCESYGLMQIQPKWWGERMEQLGVTDLTNPYENVTLGIDLMATYLRCNLGIEWALMAYNGGSNYASEMMSEGKVSDYAKKVMAEAYKLNYEREYGYEF